MNCLSLDTFVMGESGLRRITDVSPGDNVYAFDQKRGELVVKKCTGVFDNGIKKVYEVKTLHHSIKATANHPFLVVKRNGRGEKGCFEWKVLEKLTPKDEVVVLKKTPSGKSHIFKPITSAKKGDYKVNKINDVNLPKASTPKLMELLGLYVGDGWIRKVKGELGFALPKGKTGRARAVALGS
jgi:intein/homing endonuclease